MYKDILFGADARSKILDGVNIAADAVASTMGPRGMNVIFEESIYPTITKDGVTVAQQIFLEDRFESMGAMITREAAENTNREAGDGTTSTVVLLQEIINEGSKIVSAGMNPVLVKRGMDDAAKMGLDLLEAEKKKIETDEEKEQVATISANNDKELGKLIAGVIKKIGTDGIVTVTNSNSQETEVEYVKGTRLARGYSSHMFINDRKRLVAEMENPAIILTTDKVTLDSQLVNIIQSLVTSGKRNIVLVGAVVEGPALAFLAQNHQLGKFTCVPVNMPSFGDYQRDLFYDLAALTGATVLGEEESVSLNEGTIEHVGSSEVVIVGRETTIFTGTPGDVSDRVDEAKALLEDEKDTFKMEMLRKRIGRLVGSIANIKVGGASETEQTEIKYRIEDALNSTKAAVKDGVVAGGGTAMLLASNHMAETVGDTIEHKAGFDIVKKAMQKPAKQILKNAGLPADAIVAKIIDEGLGYNALTNEYQDFYENGIIDPVTCVKNELINAVATAGILLTSNVAIANKQKKDE